MDGHTLIITGERGIGKTTTCGKMVALAKQAGWTCGGVLTLATREDDGRVVVDVQTGERRWLTTNSEGVRQGRYIFDPETLVWGNQVIARAVPCDLLVVDELGPLEIKHRQGWVAALDVLSDRQFQVALAVVRPELVVDVQLALRTSAPVLVSITHQNRDQLPSQLVKMLQQD